jgi:hypothetical protein
MSQILRIRRTQIVEKEHLLQALEDLGYRWRENRRLGLLGPRVDVKVRRNVGFREGAAAYEMVSTGAAMRNEGKLLQEVTQRYVYHTARAKLEAQGFALANETVEEDGRIHLVLRRMA